MGKQCTGKGKYKFVPVINKGLRHEDVDGSGCVEKMAEAEANGTLAELLMAMEH
jgi:hypothetical protein